MGNMSICYNACAVLQLPGDKAYFVNMKMMKYCWPNNISSITDALLIKAFQG